MRKLKILLGTDSLSKISGKHKFSADVINVSKFVQRWSIYTEMKNKKGNPKIYVFSWLFDKR